MNDLLAELPDKYIGHSNTFSASASGPFLSPCTALGVLWGKAKIHTKARLLS